tara:strand:- start:87 stop:251 length:165 start_codon:yes stop_codon:yes gene_type:complete
MCEFLIFLINQTSSVEGMLLRVKLTASGEPAGKPLISTELPPLSTLSNCTFLIF